MRDVYAHLGCGFIGLALIFSCASHRVNADIQAQRPTQRLEDAILGGKFRFVGRYRFERVEDDGRAAGSNPLKTAEASTLRLVLGYDTASFHGFNAGIEFEHISELGPDDFNNGSNDKTDYAVVADPNGTELNQAWLSFNGLPATRMKVGRQIITWRKAPLHRYLGTVLWRQNWQTHDALTVEMTPVEHLKIRYGYTWQVNRIFGNDAPDPLDKFDSNSHLLNVLYDKSVKAKIEAYGYWLDFDNAAAFSVGTLGIRLSGAWRVNESWRILYTFEYANQRDQANNKKHINADYLLTAGGVAWSGGQGPVKSFSLTANYELLGGDGGADRFVTILGTNHAFQGWADRFVITPGDGIEDTYINYTTSIYNTDLALSYHMLKTDKDSYDYGNELDILVEKNFYKHYTVGFKYADYNADRNALNLARNAAQSADKTIYWLYLLARY